jgi:hypothetical protein
MYLGATTIQCPFCARAALLSASKGLWCGRCKNGHARPVTWKEAPEPRSVEGNATCNRMEWNCPRVVELPGH